MQIYGMDEVGRGCLAGPMLACSVPQSSLEKLPHILRSQIKDSKKTTPILRQKFATYFKENKLVFNLSCITSWELNQYGLAWAQKEIFSRLISPDAIHYIDGRFRLDPEYQQFTVNLIKGDSFHPLVGLASILAKYFRDQYMIQIDSKYPRYSFAQHKGYGSLLHRQMIQKYGPCPEHRVSFLRKLTVLV